jgi:hypothetical protein
MERGVLIVSGKGRALGPPLLRPKERTDETGPERATETAQNLHDPKPANPEPASPARGVAGVALAETGTAQLTRQPRAAPLCAMALPGVKFTNRHAVAHRERSSPLSEASLDRGSGGGRRCDPREGQGLTGRGRARARARGAGAEAASGLRAVWGAAVCPLRPRRPGMALSVLPPPRPQGEARAPRSACLGRLAA